MSEETATYETTDAPAATQTDRVESLSLLDRVTAAMAYSFGNSIAEAARDLNAAQTAATRIAELAHQAFPTIDPEWVADQILLETEATAARSRIEMANLLAHKLLAAIKDGRSTRED
jgi:alpha/beta superfamily hydrolase